MNTVSTALPASRVSLGRVAFWLACSWAVGTIWLTPHLPQVDLPQHAGQVALLRDLLAGTSPWADVLRVNLLTPYLIGYLSLYGLSLAMPIDTAIALVYSVAFLAFVAACISLRRQAGGDPRLDWLFLPAFFALPWRWGFLTFLVAMPIGLWLIREAYRLAEGRRVRDAVAVLLLGAALLFAHGLVFLYAVGLALLIALVAGGPSWGQRLRAAAPALLLLLAFVLYKKLVIDREMQSAIGSDIWYFGGLRERLYAFLVYPNSAQPREFPIAPLVAIAGWAAPWLLGLKLQPGLARKLPFLCTAAMMLVLPTFLFGATHFYERFAMLLPVTYALMFGAAPAAVRPTAPARRAQAGLLFLVLAAAIVFARESWQNLAFTPESRAADQALSAVPPQRRVLYAPVDRRSERTPLRDPFLHYPLWYQAQHGGLVEFNFATLLPQVVRFRELQGHVDPMFGWFAEKDFRWADHEAGGHDYLVLRSREAPAADMLAGRRCTLQPVTAQPPWFVYRNSCGR
jgi:hypothetical protein